MNRPHKISVAREHLRQSEADLRITLWASAAVLLMLLSSTPAVGAYSFHAGGLSAFCWFMGCGYLARKRGQAFLWGLAGLIPPIAGAVFIMMLPDDTRKR